MYRQGATVDGMATLASEPSSGGSLNLASYVNKSAGSFDSELFLSLGKNWARTSNFNSEHHSLDYGVLRIEKRVCRG